MKSSKVAQISRHHNRMKKMKKARIEPVTIMDRNEVDIAIIDIVLKALYHNSHVDTLHIDDDIYKNANINIPFIESERLWEVMLNSGLVNPVAGFGNAGKLKLSRNGYELMGKYGGYREYMQAVRTYTGTQQAPPPEKAETERKDSDCIELTGDDE
ncbi:MAG TPA: hypothetical protein VIN07_14375 [Flavipsychrobacter sp.]